MPHVLGALWLLGLYAAAPVLRGRDAAYAFADRLRDALVLGVAIPFVLGFAHLLYPIALWIVLLLLVTLSAVRRAAAHELEEQPLPLLLI
ncbi:MAG: hypothetical protein JO277_12065, partial [Candidatus Eremiobacteraeota bacterium]|nr:hypothetical protein [Candidatus Eremiobacteraeota bacterium]